LILKELLLFFWLIRLIFVALAKVATAIWATNLFYFFVVVFHIN